MHAAPHIPQRPADGLPMPQRLGAILAVAFGVSLSVIDGTVANVALPTIGQQLGISAADSIWIVNAYQLAIMVSLLSLSAQGDVSQWLHFLDEVERSCKGLRVTNFSISDYDYVENNTQAVSTSLITGTLEIYLCGSGREADA